MKKFYLLLFLSGLWQGCAFYHSTDLPVQPNLTQQGEVHLSASYGIFGGAEIHGAVSPVKHWAIIGKGGFQYIDAAARHSHVLFEVGTGGYYLLRDKWLFDGYAGYGRGNSATYSDEPYFAPDTTFGIIRGYYNRVFFQGSATFIASPHFEISFVMKPIYHNFYQFNTDGLPRNIKSNFWTMDTYLMLRFGWNLFKFQLFGGAGIPFNTPFGYQFQSANFGFGFCFNINRGADLKKRKKPENKIWEE